MLRMIINFPSIIWLKSKNFLLLPVMQICSFFPTCPSLKLSSPVIIAGEAMVCFSLEKNSGNHPSIPSSLPTLLLCPMKNSSLRGRDSSNMSRGDTGYGQRTHQNAFCNFGIIFPSLLALNSVCLSIVSVSKAKGKTWKQN